MQLISCHPKIFSVPTKATLKTMKTCCGFSMTLIYSDFSYPKMQIILNLMLIALNALWQSCNTLIYSVARLLIHQNNNWLKIKNNTCFWQVRTKAKKFKQARPLNYIVQSVQNFAHKLIFLCVTRASLWSHVFPTFSFWATLVNRQGAGSKTVAWPPGTIYQG